MIGVRTRRVAGSRMLASGFALAAILAAMVVGAARPAHASTFTVDTVADLPDPNLGDGACVVSIFGGCSLRAAIQQANATAGVDTINFNIGGAAAVKTISPDSPLPTIIRPVTINGYSQPGASPNTLTRGNNAVLRVELEGSDAGAGAIGLEIGGSGIVVKGLVVNRFGAGIRISSGTGNRVEGNFVGTDASGTLDRGNAGVGVLTADRGDSNTIGGTTPAARNLISGNDNSGVFISISSTGNQVQGNFIGTSKNGTGALGNFLSGVGVAGADNTIGGTTSGAANTIAFNRGNALNRGSGVSVLYPGSTGNSILRNSIFSNDDLGIDLVGGTESASGATQNDPKDPDTGANNLQNRPAISSTVTSGGTTTINGRLDSTPNATFTVQFFSDPSGNEGKTFLGQRAVTTDANGNASYSFVPTRVIAVGEAVTATATDRGGNTSEFSAPRAVAAG